MFTFVDGLGEGALGKAVIPPNCAGRDATACGDGLTKDGWRVSESQQKPRTAAAKAKKSQGGPSQKARESQRARPPKAKESQQKPTKANDLRIRAAVAGAIVTLCPFAG
jgi:hypothetical protein